jgi:probable rRNA maturation factor
MLAELGLPHAELSVLLTDDERIRDLNAHYRGKDRATDVLAFPLEAPGVSEAPIGTRALGDVVISIDTAHRHSLARRRSLLDEVILLLAHGLLHLLGYDHATPGEKQDMLAATRRLVRSARKSARRSGSRKRLGVTATGRRSGSRRSVRRRRARSRAG